MDINLCLKEMVTLGASDLHIKAPTPPVYRIDGLLQKNGFPAVTPQDVEKAFMDITVPKQRNEFENTNELDFSYSISGVGRFRVNVGRQRGTMAMAFRLIPFNIPTIDELGLPQILKELVMKPRGLIIVTGPTGSGKSTTQAAMIQYLNANGNQTIITIEDPIEYIHPDLNCFVLQRELGADTSCCAEALRRALRHDPNVIVVGEMRDLETISTAVAAAETGHLVIGTLHTVDAPQTVDRLIGTFPPEQHHQIRMQFSQIIEAVICQTLVPRASGKGRVGAFEIMIANMAIRHLVREGKIHEIHSAMQMGNSDGMQLLDRNLAELVSQGIIKNSDAMLRSSNRERLKKYITQLTFSGSQNYDDNGYQS
jgi:twitching motility protein PilT